MPEDQQRETGAASSDIQRELEDRRERMKELEENPPTKLEDWPDDELKYETFGGGEGDHGYEEGPERQLGPSEVEYFEDGHVEVGGEEVDNPDDFKTEPIPGGPTDPDAPDPKTRARARELLGDDADDH
jgi:hypothetical protein